LFACRISAETRQIARVVRSFYRSRPEMRFRDIAEVIKKVQARPNASGVPSLSIFSSFFFFSFSSLFLFIASLQRVRRRKLRLRCRNLSADRGDTYFDLARDSLLTNAGEFLRDIIRV
jgi:hypothetical protein